MAAGSKMNNILSILYVAQTFNMARKRGNFLKHTKKLFSSDIPQDTNVKNKPKQLTKAEYNQMRIKMHQMQKWNWIGILFEHLLVYGESAIWFWLGKIKWKAPEWNNDMPVILNQTSL